LCERQGLIQSALPIRIIKNNNTLSPANLNQDLFGLFNLKTAAGFLFSTLIILNKYDSK